MTKYRVLIELPHTICVSPWVGFLQALQWTANKEESMGVWVENQNGKVVVQMAVLT